MLYGITIVDKDGCTQYLAVAANDQKAAIEMLPDGTKVVDIMPLNRLIWEQYDGVAVLGTL